VSAISPAYRRSTVATTGFIDAQTWLALGEATTLAQTIQPWLTLQCAAIAEAVSGAVELDGGAAGGVLTASWPAEAKSEDLAEAIASARDRRRGVVNDQADGRSLVLAFPVVLDGEVIGAVAVRVDMAPAERLHNSLRQLQWGVAWLRERALAERLRAQRADGAGGRIVLDLIAAALETDGFGASARAVATELARVYDCDRASVGMVRRQRIVIAAISHSASFGKDMNLVRLLGEAMDEAVDQRAVILHPVAAGDPHVTRSHALLSEVHGAGTVVTFPMHAGEAYVGALTLERSADRPFTDVELATLDALAATLAPILKEKQANDRWVVTKLGESIAREFQRLVGPAHAARKAMAVGIIAAVLLFTFWFDTYRVTADAVVEGRIQRSVVASFNGFLREAPARPGDVVQEGALLAALDDRDLILERLRWSTERQRRVIEYERALGERNRTETRIATSLMEQADAQIHLVDEQLSRARLTAPFNGVIVSGDHAQSIGAAIQRGQVLFEIAPIDGHRVVLSVDEAQITSLAPGQTGRLALAAFPNDPFEIEIVRLTPVARAEEGRNMFRVEARPTGPTEMLRPGMRGAAKIDIDNRRVIWIWTRSFANWVRLALWRWIP
jgi:hypothetical protein